MPDGTAIRTVLQWLTDALRNGAIDNPRTTAELLMEYALGCRRSQLYLQPLQELSQESMVLIQDILQRRLAHEPVEYIMGETEFMSLPFRVDRRTLIPRPETEILVETALSLARKTFDPTQLINIIDIGTGSGNIAVSMAHYLDNARVTAIDQSEDALEVARENAVRNNVDDKISFLAQSIFDYDIDAFQHVQMVLSNPPYVARNDMTELQAEVREHEPPLALHDGGNGLRFYPVISDLARRWLTPGGILLFEVGDGQAETVCGIAADRGYTGIQIIQDLRKLDRVVLAVNAGT
jgi:release factor glutamine methyltransferase